MRTVSVIFTGLLLTLLLPALLLAAEPQAIPFNEESCRSKVTDELTTVHDTYRSYVFGSRQAADGSFVVKTGGTTDRARAGILETKKRLTSELILPLTEAYRAYRCHALEVCRTMSMSFDHGPDETSAVHADVQVLGCNFRRQALLYPACFFGAKTGYEGSPPLQAITDLTDECQRLIDGSLTVERAVLKLAVSYDSGYRAVLQMSGMLDHMLARVPTYTFGSLRQMVGLLGKLHQIPCFLAQCDAPSSSARGN